MVFFPDFGPHQLSAPSPGLSDLKRLDSRLRTAVFCFQRPNYSFLRPIC